MGKFTEKEYEEAVVHLFEEQGYEYLYGKDMHRKTDDILLEEDLRNFISSRYADLSESEMDMIVSRLRNISPAPLYTGNRDTFWLINTGFDLQREDRSKRAIHIDYIDFDNPENNSFKVVNQYEVEHLGQKRIPDVLIFVNGIPIAIWELKSAIKEDATIHDAWEQITIRYARDIPNLLKYCFLSVISDGANTKTGSIFTPYEKYYGWNKIEDADEVLSNMRALHTTIKGAFAKERLIAILRDFIFYPDDSNKDEVMVCRYPQFFAANKMFNSIRESVLSDGKNKGKGGTYFGATGCGKTMTMLFLSRMLIHRDNETFSNPTIIVIVDREDLDTQASELFVTAKKFLSENDVRSIETRTDLAQTLANRPSGGVYITTIQKFCEETGLLSDRKNIICISDEAHRTQTRTGAILDSKKVESLSVTYGFAKYLRDSFPNATYCGFTGTPIDETLMAFGDIVDKYTMKESVDDGITVKIAYEPRLARIKLSGDKAKEIDKYYEKCAEDGATEEQIRASQEAMSKMRAILGHPERIKKIAEDIVTHYESMCYEKPNVVQKAMIVCADRQTAFSVMKAILAIRPEWGESRKAENEESLTKEKLNKLIALPKINLVATQGANDKKDLFDACGNKEYRQKLDKQFKNTDSNFKIAVVVDMWITGFDVPSLAVMYIDKPLKRHTLIQTISRVNRVFEGKEKGLVVDYIGIKKRMDEALKLYGCESEGESPIEDLPAMLSIFRHHLELTGEIFAKFDASKFFVGMPAEQWECLINAVEFVQMRNEVQKRFMKLSGVLKEVYNICCHSGELTDEEIQKTRLYTAVRSVIYKQTGNKTDAHTMNAVVEEMVRKALECSGVESVIDAEKSVDIFSDEFIKTLESVKMPMSKFNILIKNLRKAISNYGRTNKLKAAEFSELLRKLVEQYNDRDVRINAGENSSVVVDDLFAQALKIYNALKEDRLAFEKLGISPDEKAYYDILVSKRNECGFEYSDEKCKALAKMIKKLIDENSQYADWTTRTEIKASIDMGVTELLYYNGYPVSEKDEVPKKVMEQAVSYNQSGDFEYAV